MYWSKILLKPVEGGGGPDPKPPPPPPPTIVGQGEYSEYRALY